MFDGKKMKEENKKLSEEIEKLSNLLNKKNDELETITQKSDALAKKIERLEKTNIELCERNAQLASYEKNNQPIPIKELVLSFLKYTTKSHNALVEREVNDIYLEKLIDDLENIGVELIYHKPGTKLNPNDNSLTFILKKTKNRDKNLIVYKNNNFGCKFKNGMQTINEELTVFSYDNECKITLNYGDSTDEVPIVAGSKYVLPVPNQNMCAKNFICWVCDDLEIKSGEIIVNDSLTLEAKYAPVEKSE